MEIYLSMGDLLVASRHERDTKCLEKNKYLGSEKLMFFQRNHFYFFMKLQIFKKQVPYCVLYLEDNYYFRCHYALLFEISQNIIQVGSFSVKTRIVLNTLNH